MASVHKVPCWPFYTAPELVNATQNLAKEQPVTERLKEKIDAFNPTLPLEQAQEGFQAMLAGEMVGKIVFTL